MMKSIHTMRGLTIACNQNGTGLFVLDGGAYRQIRGTMQTPVFRTGRHLARYAHSIGIAQGERFSERMGWN